MLDPDPETRLGVKSIDEIKEHPFFKGVDWTKPDLKAPFVPEAPKELKEDKRPSVNL